MDQIESLLANHPFFSNLDPSYLKLLVDHASQVEFEAGHILFRDGEEANHFYLILHGRVGLEAIGADRNYAPVQAIDAGEILGWSWLVPPHRWRYQARALELTRAIALNGMELRILCETNQNLGYELLKRFVQIMAQRLEASRWRQVAPPE